MAENAQSPVTQDERTMAILAHALQVVGWWIAPLIIFLIQRKSRFVSFHAMQALLLQIAYMILIRAGSAIRPVRVQGNRRGNIYCYPR